jgi:hypothetical protein
MLAQWFRRHPDARRLAQADAETAVQMLERGDADRAD